MLLKLEKDKGINIDNEAGLHNRTLVREALTMYVYPRIVID